MPLPGDVDDRDNQSFTVDKNDEVCRRTCGIGTDFFFDVARGAIAGLALVHKFGQNENTGTTLEDIWIAGGTYVFSSAAQIVDIVSDDANDTVAGTGARTVLIEGLDASWNEQSETRSTDGLTIVPTVNSYLRINRAIVTSAGTGGENAGTISFNQTTSGDLMAVISQGVNQTLQAIFSVPNAKTGYIYDWVVSPEKKAVFHLRVRPFGEVFQTKSIVFNDTTVETIPIKAGVTAGAKSDIKVSGMSLDKAGIIISSSLNIVVEDD